MLKDYRLYYNHVGKCYDEMFGKNREQK